MSSLLAWYAVLFMGSLIGLAINFRLFNVFHTRGYGLAKITTLLMWGYFFWLGTSLKLITNTIEGICFSLIPFVIIAYLMNKSAGFGQLLSWVKRQWRSILVSEVVFLAGFLGWAFIRSINPEISGTEKPMELAFINAILNSTDFPPHDPWLSGYAISYYYFGYLMTAMLCKLTGISGAVGFNITLAMLFGLVSQASYDLLTNMLHPKRQAVVNNRETTGDDDNHSGINYQALLAPLFILIVSNLEGLLEVLHSKGIFWKQSEGVWSSRFWSWLNIQELNQPPSLPLGFVPERVNGIWWWRASRVLQDFTQQGTSKEIIDEFPFFSYLLGDLHPHVYSMPFVLLVIAILYCVYLTNLGEKQIGIGVFNFIEGVITGRLSNKENKTHSGWLFSPVFWFLTLALGALSFLNVWDFPIYLMVTGLVFTSISISWKKITFSFVFQLLEVIITVGILSLVLFLPFFLGFDSQAGGFLPSLGFYTRGISFVVMFAPFLLPISCWLLKKVFDYFDWQSIKKSLAYSSIIVFGLWALSYLFTGLIFTLGPISASIGQLGNYLLGLHESNSAGELLSGSMLNRLMTPGAWIFLWAFFTLIFTVLIKDSNEDQNLSIDNRFNNRKPVDNFILVLMLAGFGLILVPEFFYLRDQFGWRMNTIFKFYYQGWLLLAIAGAYTSVELAKSISNIYLKAGYIITWTLIIGSALLYPFFGLSSKISLVSSAQLSLDGDQVYARYQPEEFEAMMWLAENGNGVVAEAIGGSYTGYARVSTRTGLPTVLGWPGHESQWRGGAEEIGSREPDIELLYKTSSWEEAERIIQQYQINYVYVGAMEEQLYRANTNKFDTHLHLAFQNESVRIYQVLD